MSTLNYKQAAEDARGLARLFGSVMSLVGVLDKIGSLEEAERAADDRRKKAITAAEQAEDLRDKAKAALALVEGEVAAAKVEAKALVADAKKAAAALVASAKEKASASENASLARDAAEVARVAELRKQADEAVKLTAVKRDEFLTFERKIEKLKKQVAKAIEE